MNFGEKLTALIENRGILNKALAKAVGAAPARITEWSKRETAPSTETVSKLAKALNVSREYLLDQEARDLPPAPSPFEDKVREIAAVIGWEAVWRRVVIDGEAKRAGDGVTESYIPGREAAQPDKRAS